MKRFLRPLVLTLSVIGLSLILGVATSRDVRAAVSALVTVANTAANPVPTQSVDAKNAFQADLTLGLSSQPIAIPVGQRLVVEFVAISGIANSLSGPIQPSIILQSSLNGGGNASYYLQPGPTPVNIPGQTSYISRSRSRSMRTPSMWRLHTPDLRRSLIPSMWRSPAI